MSYSNYRKHPPQLKKQWDDYWHHQFTTRFGALCSFYQRHYIARIVSRYCAKYFNDQGVFLNAGCGEAYDTLYLQNERRKICNVDYSQNILHRAKQQGIKELIVGDLPHLPFLNNAFEGAWTIGIIEHLQEEEILTLLKEIGRTLKPKSNLILFWYRQHGLSTLMYRISNLIRRNRIDYPCPQWITLFRSNEQMMRTIPQEFKLQKRTRSFLSLLTFEVILLQKVGS